MAKKRPDRIKPPILFVLSGILLVVLLFVWLIAFLRAQDESAVEAFAGSVVEPAGEASASLPETAGESGFLVREPVQLAGENEQLDDLLVLVNNEIPLPTDWKPDLRTYWEDVQVDSRVLADLTALIDAAHEDGVVLWVASGYRSIEAQETILERGIQQRMSWESMSREEAEKDALRTIAKPGYSEHHTGLAVDFNDVTDDFESTEEYYWLAEHAAEYGFVQRYRLDKVEITGIDNESWHYRYVGREHAEEMGRLDMCLEEYVEYLKEQE